MVETKLFAVGGILLVAGVGCGGSLEGTPTGGTKNALAIALLSYADDGTLVASSRECVVRLDPILNEIDRTFPPFPFDPSVQQPGLEYFGVSRDGRTASIGWQNDTNPPVPPTLTAGGIVFSLGSGELLRGDAYSSVPDSFAGLYLSPDGLTTAVVSGGELQVTPLSGGMPQWQAAETWIAPIFTGDSSALVVASALTELDVLRASDGARLVSIAPPSSNDGLILTAISADSTTLAVHAVNDAGLGTITIWRLSDGALLRTLSMPADLTGGYPYAMALSADGNEIALSYPGALLVWSGDRLLYRHDGEIDFGLAFSPDGSTLATASSALGVRVLRAGDGTLVTGRIIPAEL